MTESQWEVRIAPGLTPRASMIEWWTRFRAAQVSHDWDGLASILAPDARFSSLQKGLRVETTSGSEYVSFAKAMYEREHEWDIELLAVRDDWCVARLHVSGPGDDQGGAWEVGRIALVQINENVVSSGAELYDESDLERVLGRLDEVDTRKT